MTITTKIYTAIFGELVGSDTFGNRYYRRRATAYDPPATDNRKKETRWVVYKGMAEPSKVPAEWHGWLHYTLEMPPTQQKPIHHPWQKPHQPNLTGTQGAYLPPGHVIKGARRAATTADYEAWRP